MNGNNNDPAIGCITTALLIFLVIKLIELFNVLTAFVIPGLIGYGLFLLYQFDKRTGNLSKLFQKKFDLEEEEDNNLFELKENNRGTFALPSPPEEAQKKLDELYEKTKTLEDDNKQIRENRDKDIQRALFIYSGEIEKQKKQEAIQEIFGDEIQDNYTRSQEFEKQQFLEIVKKREDELDFRELKQDLQEKVHEQDIKISDVREEGKEERIQIRMEMIEGFSQIKEKVALLEKDLITYKAYVSEKFSQLEISFFKEVANLKELITTVRFELKQELSDTKLQFGQEILRIDKQQLQIIDRLQDYENKIKAFSIEMGQIKNAAERFAIRGEDMLNKANTVYQRHRTEISKVSNELNVALERMSLREQSFSNRVGAAKIKLDEISNQQYLALKDIAHERIGINMLRQDYSQRSALENQKMQNLLNEKRRLSQKISQDITRGREVENLQHRLFMTEENLRHTSNRASLMQQEASIIRKLSK